MNYQGFAKTWVVFILFVLVVGGILAWQYQQSMKEEIKAPPVFKVPEGEVKVPEEEPTEEEPTVTPTPEEQIIVKQSGAAGMLAAECADKNYLSSTADYIIEGMVEKVEAKLDEERNLVSTYTDLAIEKYVKGTPFAEDKLQIVTPGGVVGEVGIWVEDQPIFHEGKRVRIYFRKTNGEFAIVCAQAGVEEM